MLFSVFIGRAVLFQGGPSPAGRISICFVGEDDGVEQEESFEEHRRRMECSGDDGDTSTNGVPDNDDNALSSTQGSKPISDSEDN